VFDDQLTDSLVRQVTNSMRQQRPRIKSISINMARIRNRRVIQGLTRPHRGHSRARYGYDTAPIIRCGSASATGALSPKYVREDSFDRNPPADGDNPFSVYVPPRNPDGSIGTGPPSRQMTRAHLRRTIRAPTLPRSAGALGIAETGCRRRDSPGRVLQARPDRRHLLMMSMVIACRQLQFTEPAPWAGTEQRCHWRS